MSFSNKGSEDELPELRTIILPRRKPCTVPSQPLRRSPRKNAAVVTEDQSHSNTLTSLSATSNQRRLSPTRPSPSKQSISIQLLKGSVKGSLLENVPMLPRRAVQLTSVASARNRQSPARIKQPVASSDTDTLLESFSKITIQSHISNQEEPSSRQVKERSTAEKSRSFVRNRSVNETITANRGTEQPSRFILDEARCDEDLANTDNEENEEDEETDLSGFIVDDDAELSYHESTEGIDSEEDRRTKNELQHNRPRRRLQRGRKTIEYSEDELHKTDDLISSLNNLDLDATRREHRESELREVIDLVSPVKTEPKHTLNQNTSSQNPLGGTNLFDRFRALKLSPPTRSQTSDVPLKIKPPMQLLSSSEAPQEDRGKRDRFTTPPTTPPQSPTKLKSPSKLLSPSKRGDLAPRSPHRQSMDEFWDLDEVNQWNDVFSPKKEPAASPRKNRMVAFDWSDSSENEFESTNDSSDSLPSPCESPSKSRSESSPVKSEKQRLIAEKKAKQAEKKRFEATREKMAQDLLQALDTNITGSRISKLSASTGGVQIIWSKTLRSTAGRANWRRTVTKPSGSPVKGKSEESVPGTTIQHFANIELAVKVIDRHDRLINTLAHEFCHLANFMISGIRDQPHGASFQSWARKVTTWMKNQNDHPEWRTVEVTTKHGYVIECKYLWICVGRNQTKAMELLNIDDEDGCGAEYGRHSKSIDTEKQRCGRCKGKLVQVRPKPRASPVKKTERKIPLRTKDHRSGAATIEQMVEIIELSD